jgi:phage terminase large subunit-like protein
MPADNLEEAENRDRVPYRLWHRQGYIETTPGRAIDKGFVVHRLGEIASDFKVFGCAYDRYYIAELLRLMAQEGVKIPMIKWGQSWKDMPPALDAIETSQS